ncbi:MAG: hypothetical protein LBI75_05725 [Brucellaceae bacterium]|jgi:hypothetical protein|nr:hypothetical protein [Brucellaceae bacterium]
MDRDHKFSGTLPLLAYAPQDFGLNAQRTRAYRARAAMGRTGVQPLRSHAQAPVQAAVQAAAAVVTAKPVAAEVKAQPSASLFKKLWQSASGLLKRNKKPELSAAPAPQPAVTRHIPAAPVARQIPVKRVETDAPAVAPQPQEELQDVRQPVSQTYAAMRKGALSNAADDQSIPQAPDLSHALAEIRQALREHEKLANARQNDNSSR